MFCALDRACVEDPERTICAGAYGTGDAVSTSNVYANSEAQFCIGGDRVRMQRRQSRGTIVNDASDGNDESINLDDNRRYHHDQV